MNTNTHLYQQQGASQSAISAAEALQPADGFQEQWLCHQPVVGDRVRIQSWFPSTVCGAGMGPGEGGPGGVVNRISRCPALKRIPLRGIMPHKLSLPAKNRIYQFSEAISNAPLKAPAVAC
ncbi:hypothetical protein CesoFtcFv8_001711 [Champsocephalus esox]|uniref:Uncharacterized protein n=2 Tax=Champsocephalus TaxID=52236 RepID=A0AAN8HZ79_CHAGU|nr:hypothetical protein CesoFtcFv8_001711 [Champsocephalus esox]KAK5933262.1 hypothetical protein CgunFtcFv8_013756 [Champsocephalus gunnari]